MTKQAEKLMGEAVHILFRLESVEVAAVEIDKGVMPTVHWVFADGTHYALKCPRTELKTLKQAKDLLT